MRFELHCHSTRSDGSDPPEELARRASAAAIDVFAVTDHDTCTALDVPGARCVRAVEITCDDAGETIHVLAYDRGGAWSLLEAALEDMRRARRERLQAMAARLAALGIAVDVTPLLAEAERRAVGRPDLARVVVERGHASSMKEAFARYLYDGGPVDLPHRTWPIADAIAVGRAAGAAMSLAHPHFYEQRSVDLVRRLRDDGLTGIEAFYGQYDLARRRRWIEVADDLGVTCTGGSDWHGLERPDLASRLGVDFPAKRAAALLRWLEPTPTS
jgi:predicted metal-dependent phosphoesterase TrpH